MYLRKDKGVILLGWSCNVVKFIESKKKLRFFIAIAFIFFINVLLFFFLVIFEYVRKEKLD